VQDSVDEIGRYIDWPEIHLQRLRDSVKQAGLLAETAIRWQCGLATWRSGVF
jgi:hypothetical protein